LFHFSLKINSNKSRNIEDTKEKAYTKRRKDANREIAKAIRKKLTTRKIKRNIETKRSMKYPVDNKLVL